MTAPWFTFSFPDFAYAFISVLLEGVPFILLGTLLSGLIDEFLPSKMMLRLLPRNVFGGICVSAALGLIFPMCECGVVPVIRRLMGKGLPLANAVAYMLAAPIVNPIVAVSTYAAFRGQGPVEYAVLRLGVGYFVAVLAAMAVHQLSIRTILKPGIAAELATPAMEKGRTGPMNVRLSRALRVAVSDFLDVMFYFVLGVAVAACFSTSVNQEVILPLALNDWMATFSLMGFAVILSLCSTSDAFIAATFVTFPAVAKLAFLVFGPMLDLKLIFIYSTIFRKRFVFGLAVGLFILVGLICVRLGVVLKASAL
jgi:uncharacterized protein